MNEVSLRLSRAVFSGLSVSTMILAALAAVWGIVGPCLLLIYASGFFGLGWWIAHKELNNG
jgi:hypothetical protein